MCVQILFGQLHNYVYSTVSLFHLYSCSPEWSLNLILQHFSCNFHLKMFCSVVFLFCMTKSICQMKKCKCKCASSKSEPSVHTDGDCSQWMSHEALLITSIHNEGSSERGGQKIISIRDRQAFTPTRLQSLS